MGRNLSSRCQTHIFRVAALINLFLLGVGVPAGNVMGLTPYRFETADEQVLGTIGALFTGWASVESPPARSPSESNALKSPPRAPSKSDDGRRIILEAGETRLFGIPDLKVDGFRITLKGVRYGFSLDMASLSSGVGSEKTTGAAVYYFAPGQLILGARLDGSLADIPPLRKVSLVTANGFLLNKIIKGLFIGGTVEDLRLSGEPLPGADVSLLMIARTSGFFTVVFSLEVDRWGTTGVGFVSSLRPSRLFRGSFGYDDISKQFKTGVTLSGGSVEFGIGVLFHPVLGISRSVFLRWGR